MVMPQGLVVELVTDRLFPLWQTEKKKLDRVDRWYRWDQEDVVVPHGATREMRALVELSKTPWLGLVVSTVAQAMYVDGYTSPHSSETTLTGWQAWNRNDWDARQLSIHRGALAYGYAFGQVLPGKANGENAAVLRGFSPRRMQAVYQRPSVDDWPMYTILVETSGSAKYMITVMDEECEYILSSDSNGSGVEFIEYREHNIGVCPVVKYWDFLDLEARAAGEVEPFIPVAGRINKTSFDRLMTQHFNSWKVRTIAGMARPDPPEGLTPEEAAAKAKLKLRQDDVLISEDPDTKFGSLPETPLDGFVRSWEADIEALAAVTQTPTHALTGKLINLSAEALAAARAQLSQKVTERQKAFGKGHSQLLRLAAHVEGDTAGAADFESHVTWQDMEIRSLSQAVDALGKASQMLGVPQEALWYRIPGVTRLDVDEWKKMNRRTQLMDVTGRLRETADAARADERTRLLVNRGNAATG